MYRPRSWHNTAQRVIHPKLNRIHNEKSLDGKLFCWRGRTCQQKFIVEVFLVSKKKTQAKWNILLKEKDHDTINLFNDKVFVNSYSCWQDLPQHKICKKYITALASDCFFGNDKNFLINKNLFCLCDENILVNTFFIMGLWLFYRFVHFFLMRTFPTRRVIPDKKTLDKKNIWCWEDTCHK